MRAQDIGRYASVVPEWEDFLRSAGRREPTTLRVHAGRISPAELRFRLERQGFSLDPVEGMEDLLRVLEGPYPVSWTLEHWLGLFYLQQAVTGVAALALGVEPGDRVLDLCAAPGGKTAHVAELTGPDGMVVAADWNEKRIRALLGNLYRMGHASALVLSADGRVFPEGVLFDRVLVDAPCSAEGTLRRSGGVLPFQKDGFRARIANVQEALLRRAVRLVRPGGTVLYVTCTFAPEENESVVARVLDREPVRLLPIELELPHAPGLARFGGTSFPSEMERAWRLYPHHLDSGGLFMALLRRDRDPGPSPASAAREAWPEAPPAYPAVDAVSEEGLRALRDGLRSLEEDMGVAAERLAAERWMVRGDTAWVHGCGGWPVAVWEETGSRASDWRFVSVGLRAFRPGLAGRPRPTNDLLRRLGGSLRDRVVQVGRGELLRTLEEGTAPVTGVSDGYVALALEGFVLGRARVLGGRLVPEIPAGRARVLREGLRVAEGVA